MCGVTLFNNIVSFSRANCRIRHRYIALCAHHPRAALLPSPYVWPPLPSSCSLFSKWVHVHRFWTSGWGQTSLATSCPSFLGTEGFPKTRDIWCQCEAWLVTLSLRSRLQKVSTLSKVRGWFPKYGSQTSSSSSSSPWELCRNANHWAPSQSCWMRSFKGEAQRSVLITVFQVILTYTKIWQPPE